jgi:hypothetical protein
MGVLRKEGGKEGRRRVGNTLGGKRVKDERDKRGTHTKRKHVEGGWKKLRKQKEEAGGKAMKYCLPVIYDRKGGW